MPNSGSASPGKIPIFDTHAHLDVMAGRRPDYVGAGETALETMDQYGIQTAVIILFAGHCGASLSCGVPVATADY